MLGNKDIIKLLEHDEIDLDLTSLLIEYLEQFNLENDKEFLYKLLKVDYPNTIKLQIFNLLDNKFGLENLDLDYIEDQIKTIKNQVFYNNFFDYLNGKYKFEKNGTVMLQSMFYGDFEDSGKGNNGGLAILLKTLGNEVSKDTRIDAVITITICEMINKPFMTYYGDDHLFVRLPAYLDRNVTDPFLKRELFIKRYIKKFLIKANIKPDILHIRYLDNASMAVANLTSDLNKKLVLTLAPDPHRNMVNEKGQLNKYNFSDLIVLANKIKIGDELINSSHKVLGIGGNKVKRELDLYFPQFKKPEHIDRVKMIAEGIKTEADMFTKVKNKYVCEVSDLIGIDPSFCDNPIILNVGRLAKVKGQVELFKAWANSKLCTTHNLLIIGGDLENPNKEEKEILGFFRDQLELKPHLKEKFFHKGAMHNEKVRLVEKSIMQKSFDYPHIYLCSSIKEEFGIAILEAMSRGFLILAPIKGGVKSYINNRENGFLINTFNYQTIIDDAEEIVYNLKINLDEFNQIRQAGVDTIEKEFSIEKIAKEFTATYLEILGER